MYAQVFSVSLPPTLLGLKIYIYIYYIYTVHYTDIYIYIYNMISTKYPNFDMFV